MNGFYYKVAGLTPQKKKFGKHSDLLCVGIDSQLLATEKNPQNLLPSPRPSLPKESVKREIDGQVRSDSLI